MSRQIAHNKRAGFDVDIEEKFEAGLVLKGDEIKSIREGRAQLVGGYVKIKKKNDQLEAFLIGLHLSKSSDPERVRKLLLHKRELQQIEKALETKGKAAVGLTLFLKKGWAKVIIGVGSGRKHYDKRRLLKERDLEREQRFALKDRK